MDCSNAPNPRLTLQISRSATLEISENPGKKSNLPAQLIPTLAYRDVFGGEASLGLVEKLLSKLAFEDLLGIATRVGKSLGPTPEAHLYERQLNVARGVFGDSIANKLTAGKNGITSAIIGRALGVGQLVLLGANHCENGPRTAATVAGSVGRALLATEDVLNRRIPPDLGVGIGNGDAAHATYLFAVHCVEKARVPRHDLGRTYRIMSEIGPALRTTMPDKYVDLEAEILSAIGVPFDACVGIAIALSKLFVDDQEIIDGDVYCDTSTFFSTVRDQSFVAPFRAMFVTSQAALSSASRAQDHADLLAGHVDLLPLRARPFVEANGRVYCPLSALAVEKLSTGLVHTIVDAKPDDTQRSKKIRSFMGHAFEAYVEDLLPAISTAVGAKLIHCNDAREWPVREHDSKLDWILETPSHVILIDAKSSLVPLAARSGFAPDILLEFASSRLKKFAAQCAASLSDLERLRHTIGVSRAVMKKPVNCWLIALDEDLAEFPFPTLLADYQRQFPRLRDAVAQIIPIGAIERLHTLALDTGARLVRGVLQSVLVRRNDPFAGPWNAIQTAGGGDDGSSRVVTESSFKKVTQSMLHWVRRATEVA
jgi:hypothetical protein